MELTPLNILYGVLAVFVVVVGGLLAVVLWQLSLAVAQARSVLLPQVHAILSEAQHNLSNVDAITDDVNRKLEKLDEAVDAANQAVQAIGKTTVMVNTAVAQPAVVRAVSLMAGLRGAWTYMADHGFKPRRRAVAEPPQPSVVRAGDR